MQLERNWYKYYSGVPRSIDYPKVTMYEAVLNTASRVSIDQISDLIGFSEPTTFRGAFKKYPGLFPVVFTFYNSIMENQINLIGKNYWKI